MQDLDAEIDIFALQGEEGIRKKLKELEKCERYVHSLCQQDYEEVSDDWTDGKGMPNGYYEFAYEQTLRAVVMCEKQKCTNVQLVAKVVENAMQYHCSIDFLLKPILTLMDNGHFVRLQNPQENASPEFVEFFILSFKKGRLLFLDMRLENNILLKFLRFDNPYKTIELLRLLLRYGVGIGHRSMKPERIMALLLTNLVIVVIREENGDASFGDRRKVQEMVDIVKKTFLFNCDLVRRWFMKYILEFEFYLRISSGFDMPKQVEGIFHILESRGLVKRKELFQIPSLKHMCKVSIRGILNQKWELPEGIDKLEGIPRYLKCYLDLMTD